MLVIPIFPFFKIRRIFDLLVHCRFEKRIIDCLSANDTAGNHPSQHFIARNNSWMKFWDITLDLGAKAHWFHLLFSTSCAGRYLLTENALLIPAHVSFHPTPHIVVIFSLTIKMPQPLHLIWLIILYAQHLSLNTFQPCYHLV